MTIARVCSKGININSIQYCTDTVWDRVPTLVLTGMSPKRGTPKIKVWCWLRRTGKPGL